MGCGITSVSPNHFTFNILIQFCALGHASGSVMGCSNGLGPGIANLEEVLTDNDSDSCNALTPASLQRQQQHIKLDVTASITCNFKVILICCQSKGLRLIE